MLAIVIPFYKIDFFEDCLNSLAEQRNQKFKLYIGNDASPDDPTDLIQIYSKKISIEYFSFDSNLGKKSLVSHWNRCIQRVGNEEWIMILGDDDKLDSNCVSEFYDSLKQINEYNLNVVRFSTIQINGKGHQATKQFIHPQVENSIEFLLKKIRGETRSSLSEYVFRREIFLKKKLKSFPLGWHTDDLALLEMSNYKNIFTINDAIVFFRNSGLNISSQSHNVIEKNKASFLFYFYLLDKRRHYFNAGEIELLLEKFKKCYENDKRSSIAFLKFTKVMFKERQWRQYFDFIQSNLVTTQNN